MVDFAKRILKKLVNNEDGLQEKKHTDWGCYGYKQKYDNSCVQEI